MQLLAEGVGPASRLQADSKRRAGDGAFLPQGRRDSFDGRIGGGERSSLAQSASGHADDLLVGSNERTARKTGIERQVWPNVGLDLLSAISVPLAHQSGEYSSARHKIAAPGAGDRHH